MDFQGILKKLGPIKNELLIFTILIGIIITLFAHPLSQSDIQWKSICGIIMHFLTIIIFATFGLFYIYALLRLPSSTQELYFTNYARLSLQKSDLEAPEGGVPSAV